MYGLDQIASDKASEKSEGIKREISASCLKYALIEARPDPDPRSRSEDIEAVSVSTTCPMVSG